jgi:hypothetical protein
MMQNNKDTFLTSLWPPCQSSVNTPFLGLKHSKTLRMKGPVDMAQYQEDKYSDLDKSSSDYPQRQKKSAQPPRRNESPNLHTPPLIWKLQNRGREYPTLPTMGMILSNQTATREPITLNNMPGGGGGKDRK